MKSAISLDLFHATLEKAARETQEEFRNLFFDYAGIIPTTDQNDKYNCTPLNTIVFARTGGDGVHYSLLELSDIIQPVIMTVPMKFGESMENYNCILGENLNEFLSLGYYNGWFPLEQILYKKENNWAIKYYQTEDLDIDYQSGADIQFVKKMRQKLGYPHIQLSNERLDVLKQLYFDKLVFKEDF